jgi:hypothetical protein
MIYLIRKYMTEDSSKINDRDCIYCRYYEEYETPEGKQSFCAVNPSLLGNATECGDYDDNDLTLEDRRFIKVKSLAESIASLFPLDIGIYHDSRTGSTTEALSPLELLKFLGLFDGE